MWWEKWGSSLVVRKSGTESRAAGSHYIDARERYNSHLRRDMSARMATENEGKD